MRAHLISTLLSVLLSVISAEIYEFDVGIPTDDDPAVEKLSIKKPQTRVAVGEGSRDEPGAPAGHGAEECRNLHFTQESCPTRLSDIHRSLTEEVNRERKDKELKLEVEWKGDFKERKPGEYIVRAKLGGSSRCYRYTIRDVDECRVEGVWRQQCHSSTECVNRNGSYACQCPFIESIGRRSTSLRSSKWQCEGKSRSDECCGPDDDLTHSRCKSDFRCYESECKKMSSCDPLNGVCVDHFNERGHSCSCREGFVGNGRQCPQDKPTHAVLENPDGSLSFLRSSDGTVEKDVSKICGCTRPVKATSRCKATDCCGGKVPCNEQCAPDGNGCVCKQDFVNETVAPLFKGEPAWRCVDKTPPRVRLFNSDGSLVPLGQDSVVKISQCETYEDYGYDVEDDNKDVGMRKFEMSGSVPPGCLTALSTHNISFKVWTGPDQAPWTFHQVQRVVQVVDVNECEAFPSRARSADSSCPACLPRCAEGATCSNTEGSYACACPVCGKHGDGFNRLNDAALRPSAYVNGTGCVDSCAPHLRLLGDNPKVFTFCKCEGPLDLCPAAATVDEWEARLEAMMNNSPDELCPGHAFPCATAKDLLIDGRGTRDVSSRIRVGRPLRLGTGLKWTIPYDVEDEAGNRAPTVYRQVAIQERTLAEAARDAEAATSTRGETCTCPAAQECAPCPRGTADAPELPCVSTSDPTILVLLIVLATLLFLVYSCAWLLRDDDPRSPGHSRSQLQIDSLSPRRFDGASSGAPAPHFSPQYGGPRVGGFDYSPPPGAQIPQRKAAFSM